MLLTPAPSSECALCLNISKEKKGGKRSIGEAKNWFSVFFL